MDALKKSLASEKQAARPPRPGKAKGKKPKRAEGQREMLLPISGQRQARRQGRPKEEPKKAAKPARDAPRARARRAVAGRRSLFQRRIDRREFAVEVGADAVDDGDDDDQMPAAIRQYSIAVAPD